MILQKIVPAGIGLLLSCFVLNAHADIDGDESGSLALGGDEEEVERIVDAFYDAYDAYLEASAAFESLYGKLRADRLRLLDDLPTSASMHELRLWHMAMYSEDYAELKLLGIERAYLRQSASLALREYHGVDLGSLSDSLGQNEEIVDWMLNQRGSRDEVRQTILHRQAESSLRNEIELFLDEKTSD